MIITSPAFPSLNLSDCVKNLCSVSGVAMSEMVKCAEWKRFGQSGNQLLVRTVFQKVKHDLFKGIRGKKSGNCFISELLTPKNDKIFYEARKHKSIHKNLHSVYTFKGEVYVKPFQDSDPFRISDTQDLRNFLPPPATDRIPHIPGLPTLHGTIDVTTPPPTLRIHHLRNSM